MPSPTSAELSEREREILDLVATGASNKEIAQQLSISVNTVKVHLRNIFAKIGASSRTEAAMYAVQEGLISGARQADEGGGLVDDSARARSPVETPVGAREKSREGFALGRRGMWSLVFIGLVLILGLVGLGVIQAQQAGSQLPVPAAAPTTSPRWQTLSSLPKPRSGFATVVYENRVYIIAGETQQGVVPEVESYDWTADTWESRVPKPIPVVDVGAAAIGGKIYVPGGRLDSGDITNILEIYDPLQDSWTRGADLPTALSGYASASFEGRLYLFGGWDGRGYVASVYEYDPREDAWALKMPMNVARGFAGAALVGEKVYVIGGKNETEALALNEIYLPVLDREHGNPWSAGAPMPDERFAMGVTSLAGVVYVVGGEGNAETPKDVLGYLPQQNTWQTLETLLLNSWSHMGLVPLEGRLFVMGGLLDGVPTTQNLAYQAIFTVLFPLTK